MILRATILGEPVGKGRPRVVTVQGRPRGVTPPKTRAWEQAAAWVLRHAHSGPPVEGPVCVVVDAIKSRPMRLLRRKDPDGLLWRTTKPDVDNVSKAVLDALEKAGVIRNDTQVVELTARSLYTERTGTARVEVTVTHAAVCPWESE